MEGPPGALEKRFQSLLSQLAHALSAYRPASTYRVQLSPRFTFYDAAAIVPYLCRLGITDLYLSPPFASAAGSTHGYDVVDPNRLNPTLGGEQGYAELSAALSAHGMGQLIDFVPNHMGIDPANPWWCDVLENGPSSLYAPFFDIDWQPVKLELENKVLVPVLGDQFGAVLERGELTLFRDGGAFWLRYYEHRFPIAPRAVPRILQFRLNQLTLALGPGELHLQELLSITASLEKLAPRREADAEHISERAREKEVAKRRLSILFEESAPIREFVEENVRLFNGVLGEPRSFDRLEALLDAQAYRLAHWRVAGEEINYRRFFDINSLAAIRMEDERVFHETHRLLFKLVRERRVVGLRIDHPDGLNQPTAYFHALQETYLMELARVLFERAGGGEAEFFGLSEALRERLREAMKSGQLPARPLYLVVEKILEGRERMPESWSVDGTTGYEALCVLNALFVDGRSEGRFSDIYAKFIGRSLDFTELVYEKKRLLMASSMASELNMLSHRLNRISERDRRTRDFTLNSLSRALGEFVAVLPVYRTYVEGTEASAVAERDRRYIEFALTRAARRTPDLNRSVYDFLKEILLLKHPPELDPAARAERIAFVRKLQQVTGPINAKANEDTAFYLYNRLVSLNEVGGDPRQFGIEVVDFHERNQERLSRWPGSLTTSSTHDTKRGEDVRLRISALSEIPDQWEAVVTRCAELNRKLKLTSADGVTAPDANEEYLFYQTLLGAWPEGELPNQLPNELPNESGGNFGARMVAYMIKALKEAKVHSSWTNPDEWYELATRRFVEGALKSAAFLEAFLPLQRRVAQAARISSLAQTALKIASPGVADVYQGSELWDLSLVDPDNRRPVDFALRARLLGELERRLAEGAPAQEALAREVSAAEALCDGRAKLLLLRQGLRLRRAQPEVFRDGEYLPLTVEGEGEGEGEGDEADRVVALARRRGQRMIVCVAPRLVLGRISDGGRVALRGRVLLPEGAAGPFTDVVTGRRPALRNGGLDLADCFAAFPVALLGDSPIA